MMHVLGGNEVQVLLARTSTSCLQSMSGTSYVARLSKLILFGEASLRRALSEFVEHFHAERNHQGKGNVLLFPCDRERHGWQPRSFFCRERLGGLLKYYGRAA